MRSAEEDKLVDVGVVVDGLNVCAGDEAAHGVSDEVYFVALRQAQCKQVWIGSKASSFYFRNFIFQKVGGEDIGVAPFVGEGEEVGLGGVAVLVQSSEEVVVGVEDGVDHKLAVFVSRAHDAGDDYYGVGVFIFWWR